MATTEVKTENVCYAPGKRITLNPSSRLCHMARPQIGILLVEGAAPPGGNGRKCEDGYIAHQKNPVEILSDTHDGKFVRTASTSISEKDEL
jgi:hypothetical protein